MPAKRLLFKSAAREKILKGDTALADAVRVTLGPKSKCVRIEKSGAARSSAMTASQSQRKSNSKTQNRTSASR